MAISSRGSACPALGFFKLALPSSNPPVSVAPPPSQRRKLRNAASLAAPASGGLWPSTGGSGVLVLPNFDQSQFDYGSVTREGGDRGRLGNPKGLRGGDYYKVLLIDDPRHTEKQVVDVVPNVVPYITTDGARELFHKSREIGLAVVIVTVREHAEFYAQMMIRHGLRSAIELDSSMED